MSAPVHLQLDHTDYKINQRIYVDLHGLEVDRSAIITVSVHYQPGRNSPPAAAPVTPNPIAHGPWSQYDPSLNNPKAVYFTPTAPGIFRVVLVAVTVAAGGITSVSYYRVPKPFCVVY
jgi:hypothetical protein